MPCMQCTPTTVECGPTIEGLCVAEMSKDPKPVWEFKGYVECNGETINVYSRQAGGGCQAKLVVGEPKGDKCLWCDEDPDCGGGNWQCKPPACTDGPPPWKLIGAAELAGCVFTVYGRPEKGKSGCDVKLVPQ